MKFWLEVYERMTDNLIFEREVEFNNEEEAEAWATEYFNYGYYACITKL